jgi:hypothetical protein
MMQHAVVAGHPLEVVHIPPITDVIGAEHQSRNVVARERNHARFAKRITL